MKKTVNYKVRAESTAKNNEMNYTYIEFWAEDMNEKALKDYVKIKFKTNLKRFVKCQ